MYKVNFGAFYLDQIKNSDTIIFSRYSQAKEAGIDIGQIIADIKKKTTRSRLSTQSGMALGPQTYWSLKSLKAGKVD